MSAQTEETTGQLPNGTGVSRALDHSSAAVGGDVETSPVNVVDGQQQQTRDAESERDRRPELQATVRTDASSRAETTAKHAQARLGEASTTLDLGGRSVAEQQGSGERPGAVQNGYLTPRAGPLESVQQSWMTSMEVPRWMVKLGNLLNGGSGIPSAELAPSPYPGASPLYSTPPGGATFRLRSPAKARPIPAAPTPPSSSSLPAEAIQAEVQRQLQGVMAQLKQYGDRNEQLQCELDDARRQLRELRREEYMQEAGGAAPRGLLGEEMMPTVQPVVSKGPKFYLIYDEPQRFRSLRIQGMSRKLQLIKEHRDC
ncbi:unnamed protein product [Symbiodinium necroappetens]|uniref:Uncharacterized protein n=1 Tax=Symbiodinium necroappetens TaxID=1628268 RepID=A0A812RXN0_9DINO|nr:unnamed protein product [Symbiodinium necroappetens]